MIIIFCHYVEMFCQVISGRGYYVVVGMVELEAAFFSQTLSI